MVNMLISPAKDLITDLIKVTITSGRINLTRPKALRDPPEAMKEPIQQKTAHTATGVGSLHGN